MLPLFEKFPTLEKKLKRINIGEFPTAVDKLDQLGQVLGIGQFYAKREDQSGKLYGGNKIRALEFLFGDAIDAGYQEVFALGFPASCMALAVAIYSRELGLHSTAFLNSQSFSGQGRRHLLAYLGIGADVRPMLPGIIPFLCGYRLRNGRFPKLMEASSPMGMLGYVNAGFELAEQVRQGVLPEPDAVYIALATFGTGMGLALGMKAAGLKSRVVGVDVGPSIPPRRLLRRRQMVKLYREANALLHAADATFPVFTVSGSDFEIRSEYGAAKNSLMRPEGIQAMRMVEQNGNLALDEMFTANAFSALVEDAQAGGLRGKNVLWWNSYNSRELPANPGADYHQLPPPFHRYFL